jgi:hypothetical protein
VTKTSSKLPPLGKPARNGATNEAAEAEKAAQAIAEVRAKAASLSQKLNSPEAQAWFKATFAKELISPEALAKVQADLAETSREVLAKVQADLPTSQPGRSTKKE